MRANHDFAPPPVQLAPGQDGQPQNPCPEPLPGQPKVRKGWFLTLEKDLIDYDDGAWM